MWKLLNTGDLPDLSKRAAPSTLLLHLFAGFLGSQKEDNKAVLSAYQTDRICPASY